MSHLTLYRKYRPASFADLVGQDVVSRALSSAVAQSRVAHAYIFTGIRGTGKTSAARLLAKALLCELRSENGGEPCNHCAACTEVGTGSALDLVEIDAASNRGIDEIRDLRERVRYLPAAHREGSEAFKLYIIDEAHMLTTEAFNALLKTLEEPPPHVVFILCTTDIDKMPATVLGRCQRFHFRPLPVDVVAGQLARIAAAEGASVDGPVLDLMARASGGSLRDAIGFLDQALGLGDRPEEASVRRLLGLVAADVAGAILDSILAGDGAATLRRLAEAQADGTAAPQLALAMVTSARDRLLEGDGAAGRARLLGVMDELLRLIPELRHQPDPRPLVEAAMVRLAFAGETAAAPGVETRPAAAGGGVTAAPSPAPPPATATAPAPAPVSVSAGPPPAAAESAAATPPTPVVPRDAASPVVAAAAISPSAPGAAEPAMSPPAGPTGELSLAEVTTGWAAIMDQVRERDFLVHAMLKEAQPAALDSGVLTLAFRYGFHCERVSERENSRMLVESVRAVLGHTVNLNCVVRPEASGAPEPPTRPQDHPSVRAVLETVGGEITSIRPKGGDDGS